MRRAFPLVSAARRLAACGLLALGLAACGEQAPPPPAEPQVPRAALTPATFAQLPGWQSDGLRDALPALRASCERMTARNSFPSAPEFLTDEARAVFPGAAAWQRACAQVAAVPPGDAAGLRRVLTTAFVPYAVADAGTGSREGTFTGYYEAELRGSPVRQGAYQHPVYGVPSDLVSVNLRSFDEALPNQTLVGRVDGGKLVRYHDRAAIETGAVAATAPVVMWTDDAVDLHVLHVQGSGRVVLPDGTTTRVGYAGNNGWKFVGIGKILKDAGVLAPGQGSMQDIRAWLKANPQVADDYMRQNPRYIFFRKIDGNGPIGAQGVALTPARSMAVDTRFVPLGAPLWLDAVDPDGRPLQRLMVAQDVGSAIKGQVRGDFFWGTGEAALAQAGRMKSPGRYYVLLPRAAGS
ncbi:murein transglycosylase A [Caenispirillum bisanense]|uniref:peptidoglycan lytic exotransglycosylase n=1 Tax=Caenispirillum bisanense TaxID=414052 RepID=A0A286G9V2_9PROT|nr:MltA domain-containing protein [Caenispirillum bisanense]SOD92298.1 membrane-bound lytic murein transglycosylase A [Caenispirillum bisanense]